MTKPTVELEETPPRSEKICVGITKRRCLIAEKKLVATSNYYEN